VVLVHVDSVLLMTLALPSIRLAVEAHVTPVVVGALTRAFPRPK